jgi:hypothetical protein
MVSHKGHPWRKRHNLRIALIDLHASITSSAHEHFIGWGVVMRHLYGQLLVSAAKPWKVQDAAACFEEGKGCYMNHGKANVGSNLQRRSWECSGLGG